MKDINIEFIPHNEQRVGECGDYLETPDYLVLRISKMPDDYEMAVVLHELIEMRLCQKRGIKFEDIDQFDKEFYKNPKNKGKEAGMSKLAPYGKEHRFAMKLERMFIKELGISWVDYEKYIEKL